MGDIIEKIKRAESGNPYTGSVGNASEPSHTSEKGSPMVLKHSLNDDLKMTKPINLNEGTTNEVTIKCDDSGETVK